MIGKTILHHKITENSAKAAWGSSIKPPSKTPKKHLELWKDADPDYRI
ncbi:MAG: hypothetical protein ACE5IY_21990 [bacterium]